MKQDQNASPNSLQILQDLLRKLFRADAADLDFGIYRIINQRRKLIEDFIDEELPAEINKVLDENAEIESDLEKLEPHGMIHEPINKNNPKIMLFKRLRDFSYRRFRGEHVQMDSFIISDTPITKLRYRGGKGKQELQEKWHILFPDENDLSYLSTIFQD